MLVRQLDNIRAVATTELANKRHSAVNALEESAWPHRSAYLETAEVVSDVKKSSTKFDLRDIFADVGSVAFSPFTITHVQTLPRSNTERDEFETRDSKSRKFNCALTISHMQSIGRIGAASPCATAALPALTCRAVTPSPANDNWSPLEAA